MSLFACVSFNHGGNYVVPLSEVGAILSGDMEEATKGDAWTVEVWEMTQAEFDAMPEFQGH